MMNDVGILIFLSLHPLGLGRKGTKKAKWLRSLRRLRIAYAKASAITIGIEIFALALGWKISMENRPNNY